MQIPVIPSKGIAVAWRQIPIPSCILSPHLSVSTSRYIHSWLNSINSPASSNNHRSGSVYIGDVDGIALESKKQAEAKRRSWKLRRGRKPKKPRWPAVLAGRRIEYRTEGGGRVRYRRRCNDTRASAFALVCDSLEATGDENRRNILVVVVVVVWSRVGLRVEKDEMGFLNLCGRSWWKESWRKRIKFKTNPSFNFSSWIHLLKFKQQVELLLFFSFDLFFVEI